MSRLRSPQIAAKRAARAAKEAEQRRKENRKSRWMIIGLAVVSISLVIRKGRRIPPPPKLTAAGKQMTL